MFKEFKEFAIRGNVVDMAVGIVIGAAFGAIVKTLVSEVIMPPVGLLLGGVDFADLFFILKGGTTPEPYATLAAAKEAGAVTLNYGVLINTFVNFIIVAFAIFFVVRGINNLKKKEEAPPAEPTTRECPFCLSTIPIQAKKCGHCTSEVKAA